jgi:alpha-L-fucosidase
MRTTILGWFCLLILVLPLQAQTKSSPKKRPTPSPAQMDWHATNFYLFFHFGPNTFTDQEWGHGTEPEDIFNPTAIDCDQWCRIALQAGAKGVVITAKHHDGFCLWPSQYSKHTVRESKWMDGKGDVIRMLRDACQRNGLKFGVYLSPWDRNHPKYGTPAYNDVYANTLTELLTSYGDLFEIWWDGANGEGPNGKKQVYDFHRFEKIAAQYQPNAVVFSDIGPGCRWAGNENGTLNETNWCMLDTAGFARGLGAPDGSVLQTGQENGALWLPAECDVSIRPGWFYHAEEDDKVKTPDQLFDIYLKSVGHGANLILNVPPDRSGRIHAQDSAALVAFGAKLRHTFDRDLAQGHKILWSHKASEQTGKLDLGKVQTFSTLVLKENIAKGQTIQSFVVEIWKSGKWIEIARSTTVGNKKILQIAPVQARKIQVRLATAKPENSTPLKSLELFD